MNIYPWDEADDTDQLPLSLDGEVELGALGLAQRDEGLGILEAIGRGDVVAKVIPDAAIIAQRRKRRRILGHEGTEAYGAHSSG